MDAPTLLATLCGAAGFIGGAGQMYVSLRQPAGDHTSERHPQRIPARHLVRHHLTRHGWQ